MKRIITFLCAIMFAGAVFGQTIYDYNPISNISPNPGFCSIFHYWGFIGDSLCSGEFEYTRPDDKTGYWGYVASCDGNGNALVTVIPDYR